MYKFRISKYISYHLISDTFKLVYVQVGPDIDVTFDTKSLTWPEEKSHKFQNPSLKNALNSTLKGAFKDYTSPPNWKKPIYELNPYEEGN